jgi:type I restriction enzyme M protein
MKNKYCTLSSLRNEADVEQNFVRRLLGDLGYSDTEILPRQSLDALTIGGMRGHPQALYKPDFGLRVKRRVRWLVEAKTRGENLDKHEWQPRAYCVLLNGTAKGERPVKYHLLTNGEETRLYDPNLNDPILELEFSDFSDGNANFEKLRALLSRDSVLDEPRNTGPIIRLQRGSLSEINAAFVWCHQHIYKKDNISQSDAFTEFVKLISLKLVSDRRIRDTHPELVEEQIIEVPVSEVDFSLHWIEQNERNSPNPINDTLFRNFMVEMERDIVKDKRKRIFETNDEIHLKPETIRGVVKRLENIYLFGVDADLNGRLFETFLNATMRGKDLGQFSHLEVSLSLGLNFPNYEYTFGTGMVSITPIPSSTPAVALAVF